MVSCPACGGLQDDGDLSARMLRHHDVCTCVECVNCGELIAEDDALRANYYPAWMMEPACWEWACSLKCQRALECADADYD